MSTKRKIAHNTVFQLIGKVISTLLGLFAIGMMTRYLGVEKFGWYSTAINYLQYIAIVIDFGLIPVTATLLSERPSEEKKLLQNLLGFRFITSALLLGIAPLPAFFLPYPTEVKLAIALCSVSFIGVAMNQIFLGYYQTKLKMHIQAIGEVVGRIILVGGLALAITGKASFLWVMSVTIISNLSYTLVLWLAAKKFTTPTFAFDWQVWKMIYKKMRFVALSIFFNVMYLRGDMVLLPLFRSQTEVGIYGAAYRVVDILSQIAMMVMGIMLPLLIQSWVSKQKEEFKERYQLAFDAMMLLAVPIVVGVFVLAKPIMYVVGGTEFLPSAYPLQILTLAVFGVYVGAIFGHTALSISKQKETIWVYASCAVLTLLGYFIFIPKYGIMGAAWMSVFSELYAGFFLFVMVKKYTSVAPRLKTFFKIFFSSLFMGGVLFYSQSLPLLFLIPVGMGAYGLMLFLTRAISLTTLKEISKIKA